MRNGADLGANHILTLSEALEHEDASGHVNADAIALPVLRVDLFSLKTEVAALVDVAEHAEAELDWMGDGGVQRAESILGLLYGDGACHLVSDAFLVGGRPKVGFCLKVEASAAVSIAIGLDDEGG